MGGSLGDSSKQKSNQTNLPSPEAIAAMREAADTASGIAGVQKNLPYVHEQAYNPAYYTALNDSANTWRGWMGQAPLDVTAGMPAPSEGKFGTVIDYGQRVNDAMASLSPDIQAMLSRWTGPGLVTAGSPYEPIKYDPYLNQKKALKKNKKKGISQALQTASAPPPTYSGGSLT